MKIIIAPDSFKGSLSAVDVSKAIAEGVRKVIPKVQIDTIPMADGGEGTVHAMVSATDGNIYACSVQGPLGKPVTAEWGLLGDGKTAVIEMAAASGLPLVPTEKRNPLDATTFGTGQLILHAMEQGCRKIIIGIGGSATTDFGAGMAQALGVRFLRANGQKISEPMSGRLLGEVAAIDMSDLNPVVFQCRFLVACDVDNPLLGPQGAVYTYSPQKGATKEMCKILERNMENIANIAKDKLRDVRNMAGAGAAGGLGGGLVAFLNADLQRGVQLVLDTVQFRCRIKGAHVIITGEGKIDQQTSYGKTVAGVATEARRQGIPVIAIAGSVESDLLELHEMGVTACFSICNKALTLNEAMDNAPKLITQVIEQIMRMFSGGM